MNRLTDEELKEAYIAARRMKLDEDFIHMLLKEVLKRGLKIDKATEEESS